MLRPYRIKSIDDVYYSSFLKLFEESFPEAERRPVEWLGELVEHEPRFHCVVYVEQGDALSKDVLALLCYWSLDTNHDGCAMCTDSNFTYVEYLAVSPLLRGMGVGSDIMKRFVSQVNTIILEVEPPVCTLTQRRVAFYERLGFKLLPCDYWQPSYGVLPGVALRLMLHSGSCGGAVPSVDGMIESIHSCVYDV